jgi:hypothetical protein
MFFDVQASPRDQQGNCLRPPKIFKKLFNKKSQISLPKKKKSQILGLGPVVLAQSCLILFLFVIIF